MTLETTAHRTVMLRILKDIYSDLTVGPHLGFKGGTAAYLFHELCRFSVDLDFDLLDSASEDHIFERVKTILSTYGIVKEVRKKRFSLFFLLSYNDKMPNAYNLKIEINRRNFDSRYEVKSYLGISMKVMIRDDMAAHKLVAMLERIGTTNRDIFDTWFFLKNDWPFNAAIVQQRTGISMAVFLQKCIDNLEAMSDQGILSGIGELIDAKQKAWAKNNLRTETIFLLRLKLSLL